MNKNILRKISPLSLALIGVSFITTLTAAMIPSSHNGSVTRFADGDGEAFASSFGGETVHWAVGGSRSWTQTELGANIDGNGFSATSANDAGTYTYSFISGATFGGTSADN